MVFSDFVFLDEHSDKLVSDDMINANGTELILEVLGDGDISIGVYGAVRNEFFPLTTINMEDLDVSSDITVAGIYSVPVDGISKIKIENKEDVNTVRVYGKLVR